jgi:chitinase
MIKLSFAVTLTTALVLGAGAGQQSPPAARPAFKVIGYYAEWTAPRYPLPDIPAAKLTHVNYAFAKIGPDNRLTWKTRAYSIRSRR